MQLSAQNEAAATQEQKNTFKRSWRPAREAWLIISHPACTSPATSISPPAWKELTLQAERWSSSPVMFGLSLWSASLLFCREVQLDPSSPRERECVWKSFWEKLLMIMFHNWANTMFQDYIKHFYVMKWIIYASIF